MTVASLWKVLDNAGCGTHVGAADLVDPNHSAGLTNPWNYNDMHRESSTKKRPVLAVDLSIWICEGLTSSNMAVSNSNPALHLAYARSIKLLNLGIKLVIVIEGKRRIRRTEEPDNFRKRRSGTAFWKACKACETMFGCMGVPVVKAKAEGEALCALLNQRGVVDGVISNDGDCLLFGAKVVYTKFSIENLQNSQVRRYDSSDLKAVVEGENGEERDAADNGKIALCRYDLISFALLTGSDLAGNGLPKIGHKKAVRFLYKCKHDHPLSTETAAIDELRSWARTAKVVHSSTCVQDDCDGKDKARCCSVCNHPGDKRSHLKNGCESCGTGPGEPCFKFTGSDRFRQGLREKALAIVPKFAPAMVVDAYLKPNDNSIPLILEGVSAASLEMEVPSLNALLKTNLLVKGQSYATSREYVIESLSRLLVRRDLFGDKKERSTKSKKRSLSKETPVPMRITRQLVRDQKQCFEVTWQVQATVTDSDGNGVDGYEFSTVESQDLIKKRYPDLVDSFQVAEVERQKQGDAERTKRKEFIEALLKTTCPGEEEAEHDEGKQRRKKGGTKKRIQETFFQGRRVAEKGKKRPRVTVQETDEMRGFLRRSGHGKPNSNDDFDYSTIASGSLQFNIGDPAAKKKKRYGRPKERLYEVQPVGMTITVFKPPTCSGPMESHPNENRSSFCVIEGHGRRKRSLPLPQTEMASEEDDIVERRVKSKKSPDNESNECESVVVVDAPEAAGQTRMSIPNVASAVVQPRAMKRQSRQSNLDDSVKNNIFRKEDALGSAVVDSERLARKPGQKLKGLAKKIAAKHQIVRSADASLERLSTQCTDPRQEPNSDRMNPRIPIEEPKTRQSFACVAPGRVSTEAAPSEKERQPVLSAAADLEVLSNQRHIETESAPSLQRQPVWPTAAHLEVLAKRRHRAEKEHQPVWSAAADLEALVKRRHRAEKEHQPVWSAAADLEALAKRRHRAEKEHQPVWSAAADLEALAKRRHRAEKEHQPVWSAAADLEILAHKHRATEVAPPEKESQPMWSAAVDLEVLEKRRQRAEKEHQHVWSAAADLETLAKQSHRATEAAPSEKERRSVSSAAVDINIFAKQHHGETEEAPSMKRHPVLSAAADLEVLAKQNLGDTELGGALESKKANVNTDALTLQRSRNGCLDVPMLTEEVPLRVKEAIAPVRGKTVVESDPDAWMAQVIVNVVDASQDQKVNRRLQFEDLRSCTPKKARMPALTSDRHQLVVCDMGIPMPMSPVKPRKYN